MKGAFLYAVRMGQTPDEMLSAVAASLPARTGRSLPDWLALVRDSGIDPLEQRAVRGWLRSGHGLPQNSQWAIADAAARAAGWVRPSVAQYVDSQYSGPYAALRPIRRRPAAPRRPPHPGRPPTRCRWAACRRSMTKYCTC